MKTLRILFAMFLLVGGLGLSACSDDDDNPTTPGGTTENPWVGSWISEGDNLAPLLVAVFNMERVEVDFNADGTVSLTQKIVGAAETTNTGVYTVSDASVNGIHSITISYTGTPAFEQQGIIEVVEGTPDVMRLEVVQTTPAIGATPLTPAQGFGADSTLGTSNIQVYVRQ